MTAGVPLREGRPTMPLVTIAIPTYNRADRYLAEALRSACGQTYPNIDILVSDNASADGTAALVQSIADPRIRYYRHSENIGSARNINSCIDRSKGEYTLILNDDDLIDTDFVSTCMAAASMSGREYGLIRTGTRIVNESGEILRSHPNLVKGPRFEDFVTAWVCARTSPYLCSTLFLTRALREFGMHSRHYMWDDVLTELRVMAQFGRLDIEEVHASFREHSAELTFGAAPMRWIEDSRQLLDVAVQLSRDDASSTRARLAPFLAKLDYERVAKTKAPLWFKLKAALYAWRVHRIGPPGMDWLRKLLSQEPWYQRASSLPWLRAIARHGKALKTTKQ